MADWKTRLAVVYQDDAGNTVEITPIQSYSPNFALNAEALHSIEETHTGVVYSPQQLSFSMTVNAIGDAAARLTSVALEGRRFNIVLQENDGGSDWGSDWSFNTLVMSDCIITSAAPTAATVSGAPSATFSGFSLAAKVEPKQGSAVSVP